MEFTFRVGLDGNLLLFVCLFVTFGSDRHNNSVDTETFTNAMHQTLSQMQCANGGMAKRKQGSLLFPLVSSIVLTFSL